MGLPPRASRHWPAVGVGATRPRLERAGARARSAASRSGLHAGACVRPFMVVVSSADWGRCTSLAATLFVSSSPIGWASRASLPCRGLVMVMITGSWIELALFDRIRSSGKHAEAHVHGGRAAKHFGLQRARASTRARVTWQVGQVFGLLHRPRGAPTKLVYITSRTCGGVAVAPTRRISIKIGPATLVDGAATALAVRARARARASKGTGTAPRVAGCHLGAGGAAFVHVPVRGMRRRWRGPDFRRCGVTRGFSATKRRFTVLRSVPRLRATFFGLSKVGGRSASRRDAQG